MLVALFSFSVSIELLSFCLEEPKIIQRANKINNTMITIPKAPSRRKTLVFVVNFEFCLDSGRMPEKRGVLNVRSRIYIIIQTYYRHN